MSLKKIDLFSSLFQFHFDQHERKGTITGAILTIVVFILVFGYFIYLLLLFFNNQIDPKYASQSFIQDTVDLNLQENMVGFRYEYGTNQSLDDLQQQQNQTYLVFQTYFLLQNGTENQLIQINYTKCSDPQLKGFNCLDLSEIQNFQLLQNNQENIFSSLYIFVYKCNDVDQFKQQIPNNCANNVQIDQVINNPYASLRLKLYTSQYNMTSQTIQVNYRNSVVFLQGGQFQFYQYKVQKQITKVKSGILFQSEQQFGSPIQYNVEHQTFDYQKFSEQTGEKMVAEVAFEIDEIVQQIKIQYPTFPEILALCNSTLTLLMCIGFIAKILSGELIKRDFFMLILQNIYLSTFKDLLKTNQLLENDNETEYKHQEEIVQVETENIQNQKHPLILFQKSNSIRSIDEKQHKCIIQEENDSQKETNNVNEKKFGQKDQQNDQIQIHNNKQKSQFQKYQKIRQYRFLQNIQKPHILELETAMSPSKHLLSEPSSQKTNVLSMDTSNTEANNQLQDKKLQHFQGSFTNQIQNTQQNKIMNKKQSQLLNYLQNKSLLKKLQQILFKIKICGKQNYLISRGLQPKTKQAIQDQVSKSLDILNLYKDIILLKKAIMIILNNDQLAALQLVGISSDFSSKIQNTNHFEEQFNILSSQQLQNKYIEIFFDRISSQKNIDAIDLKILSSIN